MDRYEQLVLEAYSKVDTELKEYKHDKKSIGMGCLFIGIGVYGVHARPDVEHNYQAVIDAVHLKYQKTKDEEVISFFESGLNHLLEYLSGNPLHTFCNVISYEMYIEKNKESSFNIDIQHYLDVLSEEIIINHDDLIEFDDDIDEWLKREAKSYKEKYGYELKLLEEYPKGVMQEIIKSLELKIEENLKGSLQQYKEDERVSDFVNLLVGEGDSKIAESEWKSHLYRMVVEFIHKYYDETRDEDIIKMYEKGIMAIVDNVNPTSIRHFFSVVGAEDDVEKENQLSFKLDMRDISKVFDDAIAKNSGIVNSNPYIREAVGHLKTYFKRGSFYV